MSFAPFPTRSSSCPGTTGTVSVSGSTSAGTRTAAETTTRLSTRPPAAKRPVPRRPPGTTPSSRTQTTEPSSRSRASSVPDDRTTRAVIRDEALRLFAERGPDAVTVRQVPRRGGVPAGLVIHHFGSKDGLRETVDQHVLAAFEAMLGELTAGSGDVLGGGAAGSLAEAAARHLPAATPWPSASCSASPTRSSPPAPSTRSWPPSRSSVSPPRQALSSSSVTGPETTASRRGSGRAAALRVPRSAGGAGRGRPG